MRGMPGLPGYSPNQIDQLPLVCLQAIILLQNQPNPSWGWSLCDGCKMNKPLRDTEIKKEIDLCLSDSCFSPGAHICHDRQPVRKGAVDFEALKTCAIGHSA